MKVVLRFDMTDPDDKADYNIVMKAPDMHCALFDISQQVFRPARKHGYSDPDLQKLIDSTENAAEIISKLEQLYASILSEYEIDI